MAFHPTAFKRFVVLLLWAGVSLTHSWGQAVDSPIKFVTGDAITATLVDPPSVGNSDTPRGDSTQWLKIEYHYQVDPKVLPFIDAITFNITVEGRDLYSKDATSADGVAVGLTGTETYLYLTSTRDGYGVFYIHPSTLARYATKNGPGDFTNKFNIHLEAMIDGKLMDYFDKKTDPMGPDWYKALKPVAGLVYRQDQCCFIVSDPSRYPQLKPQATQQ